MVKELYQSVTREVSLNVSVNRVDSVRKKAITKSGCRVYDGGFIGVSGCLGQPTHETWAAAQAALSQQVPSPGPEQDKRRSRDLREEALSPEDFLRRTGEFLAIIRDEFPDFLLSNKVTMKETELTLQNDAGLALRNTDRVYNVDLVVKQVGSPNVFDSFLGYDARRFSLEALLRSARELLHAHRTLLPMPKGSRQLFFDGVSGPNLADFSVLGRALSGRDYHMGASLLQGKLGERLFDSRVTLYQDLAAQDMLDTPFFDAQGVTLPGDCAPLVEQGVFRRLLTDKKYAALLDAQPTAGADGAYDAAPVLAPRPLVLASTGETVEELAAGRDAILLHMAGGGDWTDAGDFAAPVQVAYLYRDGRLAGRLPEFNLSTQLDSFLGRGFRGVSRDRLFTQRLVAFEGTVQ